jgi:hypothetical protein
VTQKQPRLLRSVNWLEYFPECIGSGTLRAFCDGDVFMHSSKFEAHCTPRFRELFNQFKSHANRMRNCGETEMVSLAARFDAENAAKTANEAIEKMLKYQKFNGEV